MKKKKENNIPFYIFSTVITLLCLFSYGKSNEKDCITTEKEEEIIENDYDDSSTISVKVTTYNAVKEQCDDTPLITADNSKIDLRKLKRGEIKWVALSRDLLGIFNYGDTLLVYLDDIPEVYVVHDLMNERFTQSIDILTTPENNGSWDNVKIEKKEEPE